MSASKMRSTHYYTPLKVESDQKDVITSELQLELVHLRKNETEYHLLAGSYHELEQKYKLLQ